MLGKYSTLRDIPNPYKLFFKGGIEFDPGGWDEGQGGGRIQMVTKRMFCVVVSETIEMIIYNLKNVLPKHFKLLFPFPSRK